MDSLNIAAIEQQARRLRAQEMQRIQGLIAERLRVYGRLLGATLLSGLAAVADSLRPLFSWNPQARGARTAVGSTPRGRS